MYAALPLLTWALVSDWKKRRVRKPYVAQANILDHLWIDIRFVKDLFQKCVYDEIERGVFHSAFETLCERRPYGESDNDIVGVLL